MSNGYFRVWLRVNGLNYEQTTTTTRVSAVAGQSDYTFSKNVTAAAGTGYIARIQYYLPDGTYVTRDDSNSTFTIVERLWRSRSRRPTAAKTWQRLTTRTFTWTLNRAVPDGYFRVWLRVNGLNYEQTTTTTRVAGVSGQINYTFSRNITVAAGSGYIARIQYYLPNGSLRDQRRQQLDVRDRFRNDRRFGYLTTGRGEPLLAAACVYHGVRSRVRPILAPAATARSGEACRSSAHHWWLV